MRARRTLKAATAALVATASGVGLGAMPASAHVSIVTYGTTFTAGSTNVFYFRVPHGCPDPDLTPAGAQAFNARTNKVIVEIPAAATGVKPEQKPNWDLTVERDGTNKINKITWTARSADDAMRDWTFMDFGVRATLNGAAGDVLSFRTTQVCDYHDDGTPATGLEEVWEGADVPKLTLVATANKVTGAADLADLKSRVVALETSVSGALTSIAGLVTSDASLDTRLDTAEASISDLDANARLGYVTATSGRNATFTIDLPTTQRYAKATVKVNDTAVKTVYLNAVGDGAVILGRSASSNIRPGDTVTVWVGDTLAAQGQVG
jgi:uncharacterized protein YcnI